MTFTDHRTCLAVCRQCGKTNVELDVWESSDGAYEDYRYTCMEAGCGNVWWVDGPDA